MRRYVSLVIWWLFVAQSVVGAEPETAAALRGIEAELIADVKAIRPGKAFTVGLKVTHDDTFHTYWQNPGIVGVPFIFEWTLPPGFSAGPIQWPAPEHVMMFDYPAYGYTRDLLLMVTIQPPADAVPKKVSIGLQASWMACGSSCHPGNHRFALALAGRGIDVSEGLAHRLRF